MHKRKENEHSEGVERERPSPLVLELDPAAISGSLMKICSRAAASDAATSQSRRRCRGRRCQRRRVDDDGSDDGGDANGVEDDDRRGAEAAASRCFCAPSDRARVFQWVWRRTTNLVLCVPPASTSLYSAAQRGPTNHVLSWVPPIRVRIKGLIGRWGY